jgi:DNA topoisomerase-1
LNAKNNTDRSRSAVARSSLVYVTAREPGIRRTRHGNSFHYTYRNRQIRDARTLNRIKALVIPPAWSDVWICRNASGHIQATGYDARGRKQYKYHREWNRLRDEKKFHRLRGLGERLPALRKKIETDLRRNGLSRDKVLATAVSLIQKTSIRVGNSEYERSNGSFGLTTLKDKHVDVQGASIKFQFKGKKGIVQSLSLKDRRLARIVKACRSIPGQELFQYVDRNGRSAAIDSGMVNRYIREAVSDDFTAKDLRTWCGSLAMLEALKSLPAVERKQDIKKNVVAALDAVSSHLGNTRTVCKNYYVHPGIISLYETGKLANGRKTKSTPRYEGLSTNENYLMQILEKL